MMLRILLQVKHVCVLEPDEIQSYEQRLAENYARRALGVQECPGCESLCIKKNKVDQVVRCPVCTKKNGAAFDFCWSCKNPSTTEHCLMRDCDAQDPRLKYLKTCEKKVIIQVPNCPSLRACPTCGVLIEHTGACKHMICQGCDTEFCFICLKKRRKIRGWQCGSWNSTCRPAPVQTTINGS